MNPWNALLEVQSIDTAIARIDHRRSQLPERAALDAAEADLAAVRAEEAVVEGERHLLLKEQKRIEDEIALVQDKIAGVEKQLYDGGSSNAKELQALQDEVASFRRRVSALEDSELEVLEQLEPFDARAAALATRRGELDVVAMAATTALAEAEVTMTQERADLESSRAALVSEVDADTLVAYDRARAQLGGLAVARLEPGGVCGACHMKLSAVEHDRIKHVPADEPVRCEDCNRYLVRN